MDPRSTPSRCCTHCGLPAAFPGAALDHEDGCAFCRDHRPIRTRGIEALSASLRRDPSAPYDCVVPVSGGKDSTFTLYYLVRELGLRPLAVHHANPMTCAIADDNLQRCCEQLGVELRIHRTAFEQESAFVKNFLQAAAPHGVAWGVCTFCHYGISAAVYQEALRSGVQTVVWSNNPYETLLFFPNERWETLDYAGIRFKAGQHGAHFVRSFWIEPLRAHRAWDRLLPSAWYAARAASHAIRQRRVLAPKAGPRALLGVKPGAPAGLTELLFYQYHPWDGGTIQATLQRELGWRHPEKQRSTWRFDCLLFKLTDWGWYRSMGYPFQAPYLSCLVREGLMDRAEMDALLLEASDPERAREQIEALFEGLGLDVRLADAYFAP